MQHNPEYQTDPAHAVKTGPTNRILSAVIWLAVLALTGTLLSCATAIYNPTPPAANPAPVANPVLVPQPLPEKTEQKTFTIRGPSGSPLAGIAYSVTDCNGKVIDQGTSDAAGNTKTYNMVATCPLEFALRWRTITP